jgi:galactose-1-phosphate uridylyltransferase
VLLSDEHRNWLAMVLAEIITDPDILEYMYKHPKTDQTVKKLISKNPFAPKEIQEHECLFCDTEFSRHREIKADDCAYIICNDYPYAPYFHYVAILRDPIHSWTELKLEHLKGMNKLIKDFLNQENKQNLGNSPGIEIGLNSSIRHLVLGKTTHSSAGASIAHVHKQICGVAPTSETLGDYLSKLCEIYNQHGIDYLGLYLDLLRSSGFIIWEDDNVALYVPFGQIAMDELQIMIKSEHGYLELTDDEISSFSKAEFLVTRLYCKLEINSFNEIMISKRFNSSAKNFRLIFTFITREIDLAISELSLVYIVDSHPEKTVEKVKDVWEAVKEECGSWVDDDQKKIAIN